MSIIALTVATANAQVGFGVKAGLNLATFSGSDASSSNLPGKAMQAGLNIGGIVAIPVSEKFAVIPEVVYSMQGVKFTGGSDHLNYINIPVLANYTFSRGFYAETGPQVGFLVSAKEKVTGQSDMDIKSFLQSTDFAWAVGLGYLTSSNVGFNARYNIGLSSVDKGTGGTTKSKINNSVLQFDIYYMLSKKKGK